MKNLFISIAVLLSVVSQADPTQKTEWGTIHLGMYQGPWDLQATWNQKLSLVKNYFGKTLDSVKNSTFLVLERKPPILHREATGITPSHNPCSLTVDSDEKESSFRVILSERNQGAAARSGAVVLYVQKDIPLIKGRVLEVDPAKLQHRFIERRGHFVLSSNQSGGAIFSSEFKSLKNRKFWIVSARSEKKPTSYITCSFELR